MDKQRAAHILQDCADAAKGTEFEQVYQMGAVALQEQAEREKGCEYCKGNALDDLVLTHDIAGSPRIALHGGNTPIDKDEKPVLCPHCGRYLGDKK